MRQLAAQSIYKRRHTRTYNMGIPIYTTSLLRIEFDPSLYYKYLFPRLRLKHFTRSHVRRYLETKAKRKQKRRLSLNEGNFSSCKRDLKSKKKIRKEGAAYINMLRYRYEYSRVMK